MTRVEREVDHRGHEPSFRNGGHLHRRTALSAYSDLKRFPVARACSVRSGLTVLVQPISVLGEGVRVSWLQMNHVPEELARCRTGCDPRQNSKRWRVRRVQRHASPQHLDALLGSVRPPADQITFEQSRTVELGRSDSSGDRRIVRPIVSRSWQHVTLRLKRVRFSCSFYGKMKIVKGPWVEFKYDGRH